MRGVHGGLSHRNATENKELASTRNILIHYSLTVVLLKKALLKTTHLKRGKLA